MTRFTAFLIGFAIVIVGFASCQRASSQTVYNVQHNGAPQFCATTVAVSGSNYNFTGTCNTPPPPNDPGAYTTLTVTWIVKPLEIPAVTDVTQFFNLFGHIKPTLPVQQWPGANGTTVKYLDNSPKYLRMRLVMPSNPGTLSHFLKAVSYGTTQGLHAKFAVVAAGAAWPTGTTDTPCYKHDQIFSDQVVLNINPGAPNTSKCTVAAGSTVDVLVDALTNGSVALSFN